MNYSTVNQNDIVRHDGDGTAQEGGDGDHDEIAVMAEADFNMSLATARFLKTLYMIINVCRDEFGFPVGCENIPYLYVSNDLFGKFIHLIKLCMDNEVGIDDENMESLLQNLLDSYQESEEDTGFTHSQPASTVESLLAGFKARHANDHAHEHGHGCGCGHGEPAA